MIIKEMPQKDRELKQEVTSQDVVGLYTDLENLGVKIWIDGGWGVDALLGKQTRPHKDLDIAINQTDVPKLLEYLEQKGFKEIKRDNEHNVVFADDKGKELDYHAFITDETGHITGGIAYPDESLTGTGSIDNQTVRCISPEFMVKFHSGYELKEKDFQDVRAICDKFGIELPEEYARK
ncbi:MAG: nucleotidyltransferase family protein [Candidatus Yanofskybacteria bacterium]|nr:nucleotidyltransferase family protein [Candidatus Yanofskybacteria bacterium]